MTAERQAPTGRAAPGLRIQFAALAVAIVVPAIIAQVWWRSEGLCADGGLSCTRAGLWAALPGFVGGALLAMPIALGSGPWRMKRRVLAGLALALVAAQLFVAAPVDVELSDGCNIQAGTSIRAVQLDRGPFKQGDVPVFPPVSMTAAGECSGPEAEIWRWGMNENGPYGD